MLNKTIYSLSLILGLSSVTSCNKDDNPSPIEPKTLVLLNLKLEDVGEDFRYENWLIVDGSPVAAGTFSVNSDGDLSQIEFPIPAKTLDSATEYVLTIEPNPDSDPTPSKVHVFAGDFDGFTAEVSLSHPKALGTNFSTAAGNYVLATPTDEDTTNENSGLWWLDNSNATKEAGLTLPTLPEGWEYEGWVVIDGVPVSTGKFTSVSGTDSTKEFSGTTSGPQFPGEDFLMKAPEGLTFPLDLSGKTVVISVEPNPDTSPAPSPIKPLIGEVPLNAKDHFLYTMDNNQDIASEKFGTVLRH